jgi:hypothetical protein
LVPFVPSSVGAHEPDEEKKKKKKNKKNKKKKRDVSLLPQPAYRKADCPQSVGYYE